MALSDHEDQDLHRYLEPLNSAAALPNLHALARSLAGCYSSLALESDDQFLATPVTKLPSGAERGEYLAIDLGGSNLRVAFINLLGLVSATGRRFSLPEFDDRIEKYAQRSWPIGDSLKQERAEDLFAWLGDCLAEVIRARCEELGAWPEEIPLGITFSFPMINPPLTHVRQNTLSQATLMPMGKGFAITSNPDLGSLVLAGYERHTRSSNGVTHQSQRPLPPIRLTAISNDSVATLISLSYTTNAKPNSKTAIGLILGTGTNASVPMRPEMLHPKKVAYATKGEPAENIVVNTEWSIRGVAAPLRDHHIITRWDDMLDAALSTPGFQPFEYMTAGTYLGEVIRFVVLEYFVDKLNIARDTLPANLLKSYGINTSWLGHHVANTDDLQALSGYLNSSSELGQTADFHWTPKTTNVLKQAEGAVLRRSSGLVAAAICALLVSIGEVHLSNEAEVPPAEATIASPVSTSSAPMSPTSGAHPDGRELVVAYCGGLICLYHGYLQRIKQDLKNLRSVIAEKDVAILLREASEGGVIGAGVLAGTASGSTQ